MSNSATWTPPVGQPQEIRLGDRVRIRACGVVATGRVTSVYKSSWFDEPVSWFLEIADETRGYAYWKQAANGREIDGGTVEVLS